MQLINRYIFWKIFLPIISLFLIGAILAAWLIPMAYESNVHDDAVASARKTVEQFKTLRAYYTKNVVKKALAESSLKPSFDHKSESKGIPLPATLIHDMSELLAEKGTQLKLYSPFPFPNRKSRKMDEFGNNAWQALSKMPDQPYTETVKVNGETMVRVGVADTMTSQVCVNCHNSRADTPKNDWKLNDLRGVLEVMLPIDQQLAAGRMLGLEIVGGIIIALALIMALAWIIYRQTVQARLSQLVRAMEQIANGDGDLTRRVESEGEDEIARIGQAFNAFADNIRQSTVQISGSSDNVYQLTEQLVGFCGTCNTQLGQQQSDIEMVVTAMNQMAASVQEITTTASNASDSAKTADSHVAEGKQVVTQAVDSIHSLSRQVEQTADAINRLEADSENIGSVLDVIRGIAEQTNLLALNAAIEAARAGEQGRGFAVVADEVRTLATRTQQSTEEIQQTIERLQSGSRQAVDAMNRGREQTIISVEHTQKVGETLDAIAETVSAIHEMNTSVAAATEEQCAVTTEINKNVTNINDVTNHIVDGTQTVSQSAVQLSSVATDLKRMVDQYKT